MKLYYFLNSRTMLLMLAFALLCPNSPAQTWSFSGSEMCYSDQLPGSAIPAPTQCFARGTLLSLASPITTDQFSQQYQSYQAGRQLGAGVGSLMVLLVRAWELHHQRVVVEEKNAQAQIMTYLQADMALFDEEAALMRQDLEDARQLETLDPAHAENLASWEKGKTELIEKTATVRETTRTFECKFVSGKHRKADLKFVLNGRGGAEWTYNLQRKALLQEWVQNRALAFVVATYQHKEIAEPARTTQDYEDVCHE